MRFIFIVGLANDPGNCPAGFVKLFSIKRAHIKHMLIAGIGYIAGLLVDQITNAIGTRGQVVLC